MNCEKLYMDWAAACVRMDEIWMNWLSINVETLTGACRRPYWLCSAFTACNDILPLFAAGRTTGNGLSTASGMRAVLDTKALLPGRALVDGAAETACFSVGMQATFNKN
jgi:hypothetical protein